MAGFAAEGELEEELEEISDEEKLALASQMLLSSPPGEIKDVLEDLKKLCPESILSEDVVAGVFKRYNNASNQVASGPSGVSVICDESSEVDGEHYMNFATGKVVKVDALSQSITEEDASGVAAIEASSDLEEMRSAVEKCLVDYVSSQYVKSSGLVNVNVQGENLVVLIVGEKLNLRNFWGGRWQTKLLIDVGTKQASGSIKIRVHYFEDGNVQMTADKAVDATPLAFSDAATLGKNVLEMVTDLESKVQNSLEEMYVNMSEQSFKDMRRVLPITRQKMDWSGAQMALAKGFQKK